MADSEYKVNIVVSTTDKTSAPAKKAAKGFDLIKTAAKAAAVAMVAMQVGKVAADLVKLGISVETSERRFLKFAGSADQAAMFMDAFNAGTDNTVDKMAAMDSAGKLLQMGLVETGDEMQQIASMATKLGDQTTGAGDRIADFAALLANQSTPRLDNFGISSGRVKLRIDELLASGQALNREQAFKMAVMEEGAKSLDTLGDVSDLASTQMAKLSASLKTANQEMGLIAAQDAASALAALSSEGKSADEIIREAPGRYKAWREEIQNTTFAHRANNEEIAKARKVNLEQNEAMKQASDATRAMQIDLVTGTQSHEQYRRATLESSAALDASVISAAKYQDRLALLAGTAGSSADNWNQYQAALDGATKHQDDAAASALELAKAEDAANLAAAEATTMRLGMSIAFTRQAESEKEAAARIAVDKEKIESEHQENISAIQAKGASRAVRLDVASEQEKLATRQFALDQAQLKVDEMTGKERESSQNAKQQALVTAQQRYAEQQKLLEDYSAGRLVIAGQNTDALIAEEERRYQEALKIQAAEEAKQAKDQKKAQGQMLIQAVDTWADQEDLPPEMTKKVAEMRVNIAEEYGMVAEGSAALVADILGELDAWAGGAKVTTGELVGYFGDVIGATDATQLRLIDLTASEYVIKVRYEESGGIIPLPGDPLGPGCTEAQKRDKNHRCYEPPEEPFASSSSFRVRDTNLDTISPPLGGNGGTVNNNSDTFIINDPRAMVAVQENRRRQARSGIARTM